MIAVLSPLGVEVGAVYFGARYRASGDEEGRKGLYISGAAITAASGLACAALLWLLAPRFFENPGPIRWIAPAIAFWAPLLFVVGILRSVKDMRGNALVYQLSLPLGLALGAVALAIAGPDVKPALVLYWCALALSLAYGIRWAWRHAGPLLADRELRAEYRVGELIRYSLPQGLAAMVFRLNLWIDILMLGYLTDDSEIGIYKIAAAISVIGGLPISALTTIFNPFIAELVEAGKLEKLNSLLKQVTHWVICFSSPVLMALFLLPDLALSIFAPEYMSSKTPLQILVSGQLVWVACAIAMRLIPMSGHTTLNLINGLAAAALNVGLNLWLIPLHGGTGAACATAITLAAWSLWRLVEIWWLLRCFPFSGRSFAATAYALGGTALLWWLLQGSPGWARSLAVLAAIGLFVFLAMRLWRSAEDEEVLGLLKAKMARLRRGGGRN